MGTFQFGKNGSVQSLVIKKKEILFPERTLIKNNRHILRGGAPVCCPIFGEAPKTGLYKDSSIPRHGFVRTSTCEKIIHNKRTGGIVQCFRFLKPWQHNVFIHGSILKEVFSHTIEVRRRSGKLSSGKNRTNSCMPLSVAFHPYFFTDDERWLITCNGFSIASHQMMLDQPLFVRSEKKHVLELTLPKYTVRLRIRGEYVGYCIWTDDSRYISIQPFFGRKSPFLLGKGDMCQATCTIEVA